MKYYSEKLNKLFDDEMKLAAAEAVYDKKVAEEQKKKEEASALRKERAAEVEEALKVRNEACKHYNEVLDRFLKDFGPYHHTIRTSEDLDWLFNNDILVKFFGL